MDTVIDVGIAEQSTPVSPLWSFLSDVAGTVSYLVETDTPSSDV